MTSSPIVRAFPTDLEVRSGGDGRTLVGIAAPFGRPAPIVDWQGTYTETIDRGAFARTISERGPSRIRLMVQHDTAALPIGRATLLREDAAGLYGEFRVAPTPRGDEVLALVRDGALDGLSIGFRVIRDKWSAARDQRTLIEAALHEVSVVNTPAYAEAQIAAIRSATQPQLLAAQRQLLDLMKVSQP